MILLKHPHPRIPRRDIKPQRQRLERQVTWEIRLFTRRNEFPRVIAAYIHTISSDIVTVGVQFQLLTNVNLHAVILEAVTKVSQELVLLLLLLVGNVNTNVNVNINQPLPLTLQLHKLRPYKPCHELIKYAELIIVEVRLVYYLLRQQPRLDTPVLTELYYSVLNEFFVAVELL